MTGLLPSYQAKLILCLQAGADARGPIIIISRPERVLDAFSRRHPPPGPPHTSLCRGVTLATERDRRLYGET